MGNVFSGQESKVPIAEQIRAINRDQTLTPQEKNRRIQALYNQNAVENTTEPASSTDSALSCGHYSRNCDIQAKCCGQWYACRLCHDETQSHQIDRKATETIRCRLCLTTQPVSNECINCKEHFGAYFCEICRLWTEGDVYHCDKCGICRKGTTEENVHCDTCGMCMK